MQLFKYISIRILLIGIVFIGLNELYYFTFYKTDVAKHADTLENLWMVPSDADAIYFGESSNFHMTEDDTIKHRISFELDKLIPNLKVATVDNAGLHAGTYYALLQNLDRSIQPKFIVITMNLRSFDQVWLNSHFETNLSKLECLIQPGPKLWNRFLVGLNAYDCKSDEERDQDLLSAFQTDSFQFNNIPYRTISDWDKAIAWGEWHGNSPLDTLPKIQLATQYIKNFAFVIDVATNPRIKDFDNIVKWGNKHNCKIIFNILSENYQEASTLIGTSITQFLDKNVSILTKRYSEKGAIVLNNLELVPDSCFVDRNWPTEHYNYSGKKMMANAIYKGLIQNGIISGKSH